MKKVHLIVAVMAVVLLPLTVQAQKYSNEFLTIGVGARAHGMAGAVTATTNDATAGYWNPAGLANLDKNTPFQLAAMHAEWFGGISKYDFIGLVKSINRDRKSAFGISLIRLGIDQIPYTLNLVSPDGTVNYNNVTEFSAADYAAFFTYAQGLGDHWTIGGNVKVIRRIIGSFSGAWGVGADLGVHYRYNGWHFAAVGHDITTTYNAWTSTPTEAEKNVFVSTGNAVPGTSIEITNPRFTLALARRMALSSNYSLTAEIDADFTTDGQRNVLVSSKSINLDPKFGFELAYQDIVYLRGGVGKFQKYKDENDPTKMNTEFQPNFGLGLRLGRLTIDYALTNVGNVSQVNYSNIFSLKLNFRSQESN